MFTRLTAALFSIALSSTALADVAEPANGLTPEACELKPEADYGKIPMGEMEVTRVSPGLIGFDPKVGRIVGKRGMFNFDSLYEMSNGTDSARFRINDAYFTKGASYLGSMAWESGKSFTEPGTYRFYEVKTRKKVHDQTMTMVGDSITWWSSGRYLRCLLSKQVPGVGFTGPHTDVYGFGHAGEGGNKTPDILKRLDKVPPSTYYFVLAGTNDWPIPKVEQSLENIKKISKTLSKKGGLVIVSTLLPRLDQHDKRNQKLNKLLLAWNGKGCNCKVIDLYPKFRNIENYTSMYWDEGLHPNFAGYEKIVDIIAPSIERAIR